MPRRTCDDHNDCTGRPAARADRDSDDERRADDYDSGSPVPSGNLAPGTQHLSLQRGREGICVELSNAPALWGVRPAADVLFTAVARTYGPASLGVVLTGMGRDGADGMRALNAVGARTIVQDEATAVIAGMPRAAAPFADEVLPLPAIPGRINTIARELPDAR